MMSRGGVGKTDRRRTPGGKLQALELTEQTACGVLSPSIPSGTGHPVNTSLFGHADREGDAANQRRVVFLSAPYAGVPDPLSHLHRALDLIGSVERVLRQRDAGFILLNDSDHLFRRLGRGGAGASAAGAGDGVLASAVDAFTASGSPASARAPASRAVLADARGAVPGAAAARLADGRGEPLSR